MKFDLRLFWKEKKEIDVKVAKLRWLGYLSLVIFIFIDIIIFYRVIEISNFSSIVINNTGNKFSKNLFFLLVIFHFWAIYILMPRKTRKNFVLFIDYICIYFIKFVVLVIEIYIGLYIAAVAYPFTGGVESLIPRIYLIMLGFASFLLLEKFRTFVEKRKDKNNENSNLQ